MNSSPPREELARSIEALVDTLACARALAEERALRTELAELIGRARRELDVADEKLLMLDRRRQRSMFRRAERIRDRLENLHRSVAAQLAETRVGDPREP